MDGAPTVWSAGELASAEVGVLTGCCYTCVSLAAQTARYPRCDHVRAQASVLWLQRAGVALYDVRGPAHECTTCTCFMTSC